MHNLTQAARLAALLAVGLFVLAAPALAIDADELIAKHIEATGGIDKIKSVDSILVKGNLLVQGMEIPFTMTQKRPDKMKIEAALMGTSVVQCYADGAGWGINPMAGATEPQPMAEMEAKSFGLQADLDGPLVDYKDKGYTVKYVGEEDVEGTPTHRLSLDTQNGIVVDFYLDEEYNMAILQETRMTVDGTEVVVQTYMSDFQDVDGLIMPYSIETRMGGVTANQIMITEANLNADVDDAVFEMPTAPATPGTPVKD